MTPGTKIVYQCDMKCWPISSKVMQYKSDKQNMNPRTIKDMNVFKFLILKCNLDYIKYKS